MARQSRSASTFSSRVQWAFVVACVLVLIAGGGFYLLSRDLELSRVASAKAKGVSK